MSTRKQAIIYDYISSSPKNFFKHYHYFEPFDKNKTYTSELFNKDYGSGFHTYQYILYDLTNANTGEIKSFIVANEILPEEERKKLSLFCNCNYCDSMLLRCFMDPSSNGCLCIPFGVSKQEVINDARDAKEKLAIENPFYYLCID